MLACEEDPSLSQMDDGAQTARQANFVRQQAALGGRQNNLTWRKYLPQPHHFHTLESSIVLASNYQLPVVSLIHSPKEGPKDDAQQEPDSKIIPQSHDGRHLLLTIKSNINEAATLTPEDVLQSANHKAVNLALTRWNHRLQYQEFLLILLTAVGLTCLHNASSCSGFGDSELYNNLGPVVSDYPNRPHSPSAAPVTTTTSLSRPRRFLYDDPLMGTMSTAPASFSQNPSSTIEPPGLAQSSWTSILNPLGLLGGAGQRPQQTNTGGGGDELDNHIKRILVPRVSGTAANVEVRQYIVNELKKNNYHVELDEFTGSTPVGKVNFANIIASSKPNACRQLVLACHYDSKLMDGFLGAIDSAVPCAMLLKMSSTFSNSFRPSNNDDSNSLGLRFIFFDGEEAFEQWSPTDSLYGSRHLAAKWAKQSAAGHCGPGKSELDRIDLFVLLDLIGASDTSFVMYNTQLKHHYEAMQRYERAHLSRAGLNQLQTRRAATFKSRTMPLDFVEDDHVPFRKRGVPILLLLAHPFPRVWHTVADNYEAIDFPKTRRILHVMEEFVSNYQSGAGNSSD